MANVLNTDKQIAIVAALAEGSSIRSIERMTGVHRDTIMRLGVKVGQGCTALMDAKMRELPCNRWRWTRFGDSSARKRSNVKPEDPSEVGSVWTFCAIDAETKLVPAFRVGDRDAATANAFLQDVAARMRNRVQISTDGLKAYEERRLRRSFGGDADYAQIIKTYGHDHDRRIIAATAHRNLFPLKRKSFPDGPNLDLISTSYIERLNATTRLHMRRLTRSHWLSARSGRTLRQRLASTSPITTSSSGTILSAALRQWPLASPSILERGRFSGGERHDIYRGTERGNPQAARG